MVGYMKQYDPAVRRAGKLLAELGGPDAIRSVEVTVLHPSGESQLAFANLTQARDVPADLLATLRAREEALVSRALGEEAPAPVRDLYAIALGSVCHDLSLLRGFTGSPAEIGHVETWGTRRGPWRSPGGSRPPGGSPSGGTTWRTIPRTGRPWSSTTTPARWSWSSRRPT
ncbi:hypothetical protein ACFSTC_45230 [Nonomuraea ferruginea]